MAADALLDEVTQAAEAALEARAGGDGSGEPAREARSAARAALDGGHAISAIAEAAGERAAGQRVGGQVLRTVERLAKKVREATDAHCLVYTRTRRDECVLVALNLTNQPREVGVQIIGRTACSTLRVHDGCRIDACVIRLAAGEAIVVDCEDSKPETASVVE